MIMVCIIEKSLRGPITSQENDLLNAMRVLVCRTGIVDEQVAQQDVLLSEHGGDLVGSLGGVSDLYLAPTVDRSLRQEKDLDP